MFQNRLENMINMGHGVMICRRIMGWKNIHRRCFKKILAMGLFKAVGKAVSVIYFISRQSFTIQSVPAKIYTLDFLSPRSASRPSMTLSLIHILSTSSTPPNSTAKKYASLTTSSLPAARCVRWKRCSQRQAVP